MWLRRRVSGCSAPLGLLHHRPNLTARSLRTRVSSTIGLVADTIATGHYGGELIRGAMTAALRREHLLLVCESGGDPALEATLAEDLSGRQVDGLIFATASHDRIASPRERAGQRDRPRIAAATATTRPLSRTRQRLVAR